MAVVRARGAQLRACYEEYGLKQEPDLSGTLSIGVDVTADGAVSAARIVTQEWTGVSSGGDISRTVGRCILERVGAWRFPTDVIVPGSHTFDFRFSR